MERNNTKDAHESYIKTYSFISLITNAYSVFVCVVRGVGELVTNHHYLLMPPAEAMDNITKISITGKGPFLLSYWPEGSKRFPKHYKILPSLGMSPRT